MKSSTSYQLAWLTSVTTIIPALAAAVIVIAPYTAIGEEVEVYRMGPAAGSEEASGFDKESIARIEPSKDKPLKLRLRDLPDHQFLKIDAVVDMNEVGNSGISSILRIADAAGIKGAGGVEVKNLRPRFQLDVDGKTAIDSSFGGQMGASTGGSFPDLDGQFLHLPGTGSANGPLKPQDAGGRIRFRRIAGAGAEKLLEHRVTIVIPHTGDEADIEFRWVKPGAGKVGGVRVAVAGLGMNSATAPFSIKSLIASVIDGPRELDVAGFSQCYGALGSGNPLDAMSALNDLISAGQSVVPMLRAELHKKGDPDIEKKFAEALKAMDDRNFETRAGAAKALADLGQDVIPLARRVLAEEGDSLSAEVKNTLKNLTDRIEKGSTALAEASRINRLHRLLDILGGEEANKLKASLPDPQLVVAPELEAAGVTPGVIEMDFGGIKGADGAGGAVFRLEGGALRVGPAVGKLEIRPAGKRKIVPAPAEPEAAPKEPAPKTDK